MIANLRTLANQLGQGARIGVGLAHASDDHVLWPEEAAAMARATPSRCAEFAAGRAAARQALGAIGMVPIAVPMGRDRAPIWPRGIVGSITHHQGCCFAVATKKPMRSSLGIDLDSDTALPTDLWSVILNCDELHWLSMQAENRQGLLAKQIFSAKEASYKALYPLTHEVVGFDAMSIIPQPDHLRFTAILHRRFAIYQAGAHLHGHLVLGDGHILTGLGLHDTANCGQNATGIPVMEMECFHSDPTRPVEI